MSVRRTVALALSATLALTGPAAVTAPAAAAAETAPYEVTIPALSDPEAPVHGSVVGAGTGVQVSGPRQVRWHSLSGGRIAYAPACEPEEWYGSGDVFVCRDPWSGYATVHDFATGRTSELSTESGEAWVPVVAGRHLVRSQAGSDGVTLSFLGYGENAPADREVLLPGASSGPWVLAQDGTSAVLRYHVGEDSAVGLLDFAAGTVTPLPYAGARSAALDAQRIVLGGTTEAVVLSRTDPTAPGRVLALPEPAADGTARLDLVGEWLLGRAALPATDENLPSAGLYAVPLAGGAARDLGITLRAEEPAGRGPDGAVYVVGTPDAGAVGVQRIAPGADGVPAAGRFLALTGAFPRESLTLSQGRLVSQTTTAVSDRVLQGYDLALTGTHAATARWTCDSLVAAANCPQILPSATYPRWWTETGDGRLVTLESADRPDCADCAVAVRVTTPGSGGTTRGVVVKHASRLTPDTLVRASGRYVHFYADAGSVRRSIVADIETGAVLRDSTDLDQSLWGRQLWSGATDGKVTAVDVRTGATAATADLGTGCAYRGIEVVGKWIHRRCADAPGAAVVHDREKRQSVWTRIPSDVRPRLGDGFLAFPAASWGHQLYAVDVRSGEDRERFLGELPDDRNDFEGQSWTVDRFGGGIAFVDSWESVRVTGLGGVTSRLTAIDADTPAAANIRTAAWKPRWWLSKPGSSWTLTLQHKISGKAVRTLTGGEARGIVAPSWDGKDGAGKYVANGAYGWSLTVRPADGQGADLTASGTVGLSGAAAVRRDMAGDDGFGDLLVMDTAGAMSLYRGTGTGALSARIAGGGTTFGTTTLFAPVGDLNGDRCADVYARVGDQLRAYRPGCGKVVTASSPYTLVGTGWGGYDVLTSPGDVNGDGFADLVARQASTGDVYFYGGTATHTLKARVRIGTNWKLYRKLVGAGDLNGDGRGDLLGVDSAGVLWRYHGTSTGGVTARVKVGGGWGGYSALAGVGDLSGDGRADLLARDAAGKLWRYASTGAGTYGGRVLIGSAGWNGFKGLF
ncbi:FG-GAP-like repeat-containing protein [Streptomyces sp. NPDC058052]|uniref:FG-GAP-like repeat-containing protein n=1 Tax=Streptomyces sp. NPDC058052 TaxID=3346316 RepID=UPI0036EA0FB6